MKKRLKIQPSFPQFQVNKTENIIIKVISIISIKVMR